MPTPIACAVFALLLVATPAWSLPALDDLPPCPKSATRGCLQLDLWLAPDGHNDADWLRDQLNKADELLAAVDVGVQVVAVHALPKSEAVVHGARARTCLGLTRAHPGVLTWLVVAQLDDLGEDRRRQGVTWRMPGRPDRAWIIQARTGADWVLAHELGHVLGLAHSTERTSVMNKGFRIVLPWHIGFTARERPIMAARLKRLRDLGELRLGKL